MHRIVTVAVGLLVAQAAWAQMGANAGRLTPLDGQPVTPLDPAKHAKLVNELRDAGSRFDRVGREYRGEIRTVITDAIKKRREFLNEGYERQISQIQKLEQRRRMSAIAAFRQFVERYPDHPEHTPDAMFRLAELYYEESELLYARSEDEHDKLVDLYERGKIPSEPLSPELNFSDSVKLYRELARRFKDYRYRDVAMYMLGYCQERSGEDEAAKAIWEKMATSYPKSIYAPEVWLRIGEYYFDMGAWADARRAYANATKYTESSLYDLALYKLAWTYFQDYDYDKAINGFKKLIGYYDELTKKSGGTDRGRALRDEAVQYLARSLAEDDWNGDGEPDEDAGVERALRYLNDGLEFEREVMKGYAKALFDLHEDAKYREAVIVYRTLIDRDPNHPDNPEYFDTLIQLYYTIRDTERGLRAREEFVQRFGRDSKWYAANIGNPAVTSKADELVETFLRERAILQIQLAQELRKQALVENDADKLRRAKKEFRKAATILETYLADKRHTKDRYVLRYYLAEMLYKSDQYLRSAAEYEKVRDDDSESAIALKEYNEIREDSAFTAIQAVERYLERQVEVRRIPKKTLALDADLPPEDEQKARSTRVRKIKPQKIPAKVDRWVANSDRYVELKLEHPENKDFSVQQAYRIGLMFYNFRNYDEARRRWELVIKQWPQATEASFSARNIINSYKDENDWTNVEKWAERVAKEGIGRPEEVAQLREDIKLFKLGVSFDKAEALYEEKKYVEAAEEFERVVGVDRKSKFADKALFNAGQAYQLAKHWNSAARVFERIVTEPRFAGSKFREDSLINLAENHRRFFAFDKAIHRYQALVREFPNSKPAPYAMIKSAELLERTGKLLPAAGKYEEYAEAYPKQNDAMTAFFQAGLVYEKMKDANAQIRLWRAFIKRHKETPGAELRIVEANLRLGDLFKARKDYKTSLRYYQQTIKEFEERGLAPGPQAQHASKAQFELVEAKFRQYETVQLREGMSLSRQQKVVGRKFKLLLELAKEDTGLYSQISKYRYNPWTIAALVRMGQVPLGFSKFLYDAPDPSGIAEEDLELYREQIEEIAVQQEDYAVEKLETAVGAARRFKIVNEWSQLGLSILNKYKPQEYPLLKSEKRAFDYGDGMNTNLGMTAKSDESPDVKTEPQDDVSPSEPSDPEEPQDVTEESDVSVEGDPAVEPKPQKSGSDETKPEDEPSVPAPVEPESPSTGDEIPVPDDEIPVPDDDIPVPDDGGDE